MAVAAKSVLERLGSPREEARVGPADAKAYELRAGEHVKIEDLQGCQVSDNTKVGADGRAIEVEPALSKPGDYVLLRAEADLLVASSACSDDLYPTNGFNPTDIMVRVFPAR